MYPFNLCSHVFLYNVHCTVYTAQCTMYTYFTVMCICYTCIRYRSTKASRTVTLATRSYSELLTVSSNLITVVTWTHLYLWDFSSAAALMSRRCSTYHSFITKFRQTVTFVICYFLIENLYMPCNSGCIWLWRYEVQSWLYWWFFDEFVIVRERYIEHAGEKCTSFWKSARFHLMHLMQMYFKF